MLTKIKSLVFLSVFILVAQICAPRAYAANFLNEADFRTMSDGPFTMTNGSGSTDPYGTLDLEAYSPPGLTQPSLITGGLLKLLPNLPKSSSIGIMHGSTYPFTADGSYTSGRANMVFGGYTGEDISDSSVSVSMDSSNLLAPGGPFDYLSQFVRTYDGVTVAYEAKIILRNNGFNTVATTPIPEIKDGDILSIEWDENGLITLYINNLSVLSYLVPLQDQFDTTAFNGVFFALDAGGENPPLPAIKAISITAKSVNYTPPDINEGPTTPPTSGLSQDDTVSKTTTSLAETGQTILPTIGITISLLISALLLRRKLPENT